MLKLYDNVMIKATGETASIIEIDNNNGADVPIYLIEIHNKPRNAKINDVVKWVEYNEIEAYDRRKKNG